MMPTRWSRFLAQTRAAYQLTLWVEFGGLVTRADGSHGSHEWIRAHQHQAFTQMGVEQHPSHRQAGQARKRPQGTRALADAPGNLHLQEMLYFLTWTS